MIVATHKQADMPTTSFYEPVFVGHALNQKTTTYLADDSGENISHLNGSYCELTALYWAWKNLKYTDSIGLSHYRRYFVGEQEGPNGSQILSEREASQLLESYDYIIAKPRNYFIETIDSHYRNGHVGSDLDVLRGVIASTSPEMLLSFDHVFDGKKLSLYNMFLTSFDEFSDYCEWLFGVLGQVSEKIDNDSRDPYQQRTFGFLGERLLNVWTHHKASTRTIGTLKVINTDGEPKIKKGIELIRRKFTSSSSSL